MRTYANLPGFKKIVRAFEYASCDKVTRILQTSEKMIATYDIILIDQHENLTIYQSHNSHSNRPAYLKGFNNIISAGPTNYRVSV